MVTSPTRTARHRPAPAEQGPDNRLGYIQGLRGIAVILVVAYHAGLPVPGGFLGVDYFFVISGFVITGLLLREHRAHGRIRFWNFYRRRIQRLLPAVATVLTATMLASALLESPLGSQEATARIGRYASVFLANIALYRTRFGYFDAQASTYPLLHTWSLAVEEQFYLGFPVLLVLVFLAFRRGHAVRALAAVIVLMSVASLALFVALAGRHLSLPYLHNGPSAAFYLPFTRLWEFGIGALLGIWVQARPPLGRVRGIAVAVAGLAVATYTVVAFSGGTPGLGILVVVPVSASAMIVMGGRTQNTWVNRLLAWAPLQWIGDTSYSWYLWHLPFIVFAAAIWPDNMPVAVISVLIALAVARLSFVTIEQRFRYPPAAATPRVATRRALVLTVICVVVPATLATGLATASSHFWGSSAIRSMNAQVTALPYGKSAGCAKGVPVAQLDRCTVGAQRPGTPVYLLGDSNAGQYARALVGATKTLQRPLVLASRSGCAFVDVVILRPDYDGQACHSAVVALADYLRDQPPGLVVLASVNDYFAASGVALGDPSTGRVARSYAQKFALWRRGLVRSTKWLTAAGQTVVMVTVIPHPGGRNDQEQAAVMPQTCPMVTMLRGLDHCGAQVSLASEDRRQADALETEHYAAAQTGIVEMDLRSRLCPNDQCAMSRHNVWVYRDSLHITTRESATLAPVFARALSAASGGPAGQPTG